MYTWFYDLLSLPTLNMEHRTSILRAMQRNVLVIRTEDDLKKLLVLPESILNAEHRRLILASVPHLRNADSLAAIAGQYRALLGATEPPAPAADTSVAISSSLM